MRNPEQRMARPVFRLLVRVAGLRAARFLLYLTVAPRLVPKRVRGPLRAGVEDCFSRLLPAAAHEPPSRRAARYMRHYQLRVCDDCLALSLGPGRAARALSKTVRVEGREHLQSALGMQRGVLAVGSHVGTVIMGTIALVSLCGQCDGQRPRSVRICADRQAAALFPPAKPGRGIDYSFIPSDLPPRQTIRRVLAALHAGQIVTMNLDVLSGGSSAERFRLFDTAIVHLPAVVGAAKLAVRAGAVVLPWTNFRETGGRIRLRFEQPIVPDSGVQGLEERLRGQLERWILERPEQWTYWDRFARRWVGDAAPEER